MRLFWCILYLSLFLIGDAEIYQQHHQSESIEKLSAKQNMNIANPPPFLELDRKTWVADKSIILKKYFNDLSQMETFLETVYYESKRAGLEPNLVLGVIKTESNFRKYAISSANARGYMQVMPFWLNELGHPLDNLFDTKTNLRYGCIVLRHYLDMEKGNLFMALGRYNGSRGRNHYPQQVLLSWNFIGRKDNNLAK